MSNYLKKLAYVHEAMKKLAMEKEAFGERLRARRQARIANGGWYPGKFMGRPSPVSSNYRQPSASAPVRLPAQAQSEPTADLNGPITAAVPSGPTASQPHNNRVLMRRNSQNAVPAQSRITANPGSTPNIRDLMRGFDNWVDYTSPKEDLNAASTAPQWNLTDPSTWIDYKNPVETNNAKQRTASNSQQSPYTMQDLMRNPELIKWTSAESSTTPEQPRIANNVDQSQYTMNDLMANPEYIRWNEADQIIPNTDINTNEFTLN